MSEPVRVDATFYPLEIRVRLAGPQPDAGSYDSERGPMDNWAVLVKVTSRVRIGKRVLRTSTSDKAIFDSDDEPATSHVEAAVRRMVGEAHERLSTQYDVILGVAPADKWDARWTFDPVLPSSRANPTPHPTE